MKFSVGDKVLLKQTQEEGTVTAIINKEMVEVAVLNTHFPAFVDELEHPYLNWFTSKKLNQKKRALTLDDFPPEVPAKPEQQKAAHSGLEKGFYIAFLPVYHFDDKEEVVAKFKLYFINQTEYNLQMRYDCGSAQGKEFSFGTTLWPYQHLYLHPIKFDLINEKLHFEFKLQQHTDRDKESEFTETINVKPKQIFQKLLYIQEHNEPMFHLKIASDFPDLNVKDWTKNELFAAPKISNVYQFKTTLKKKDTEIDLHIENLLETFDHLDNFEILNVQMQALEDAIIKAIQYQQHSLIVIHGVGTGKLREEVHQHLKTMKKEVRHFENKYSSKYGFGATVVHFHH